MGNLFGIRRKAPSVTAQDRAILQLKLQRDKIKVYQKKTEKDIEKNKELALKLVQNGMKERALIILRRKKYMQDILARTDKQLETLEQLVSDIEYTQIEVSVIEGLKVGTEALKELNNLMNIDDIQKMIEDSEEAAEKQKEISDILQRSSERYDDTSLLEELEQVVRQKEEAFVGEKLDELPKVPTEIPSSSTQEDVVEEETTNEKSVPSKTTDRSTKVALTS